MANVIVDKNKIDLLANAISAKSGEPLTLTLDEMVEAVDGIDTGGGGITPTGNIDITQAGVTDVTNYATATVPLANPWVGFANNGFITENNQRKWHIRPLVEFSEGEQVGWMDTDIFGQYITYNAIPTGTHITPSNSAQTIGGANTMLEGAVTVDAVPSANFWTGAVDLGFTTVDGVRKWNIQGKTILDTAEGDVEGWIAEGEYNGNTQSFRAVSANTSITPTESAQTIGGNRYMMEGAVTVNAIPSTYVGSGIDRRDSTDLTASGATVSVPSGFYENNASKAVSSGTEGTPTATKGTVSNHSVTVTPSVTNSAGYISGGTHSGTAVTVTASELASGNKAITQNGTDIDVVGYSTVSVNVSGTSKNTQVVQGTTRTTSSTLTAVGAELTVSKTGTYDIYWSAFRSSTSGSYTYATQLYIDGTAYGSENSTWSNHVQNNHLTNVSLTANQKLRVYGRESRGSSYYIYAPTLVIVEA